MDTQDKYKVTYFDPLRWVSESIEETYDTRIEAESAARKLVLKYKPQYKKAYIKIEKVSLLDVKMLKTSDCTMDFN